jgi:hypothetical protein
MKKLVLSGIVILSLLVFVGCTSSNKKDAVTSFLAELDAQDAEYASWENATPQFAYDLYDLNFVDTVASVYYINASEQNKSGYVIVDSDNTVIEYAIGKPFYDAYRDSKAIIRSGEKIALQRSKENLS